MSGAKINLCPAPLYDVNLFSTDGGFVKGRFCQQMTEDISCCLPCPITDWVYPDRFMVMTQVANGVASASALCCLFLLLTWAVLPVEKTNRHYLSVCLTIGVGIMNLGFVVPLITQPDQCFDEITPHGMASSKVCGASGTFVILGGFTGLMWAFMRSVSLHLQICWQVSVGRNFMIFAQAAGWGVPIIGIVLALVFSGVSFRFGPTCHINHANSLADFWIPLLIFAGLTVIITFATFGYCVKVYLASLGDNGASSENSEPRYQNSLRTYSPRQAYRRIRRVIALQWRGIAIVLIIIADVIFFSIVFVFQDNAVQSVKDDPSVAGDWILCLLEHKDKDKCLDEASSIVVSEATVMAVLLLLTLNGIWLVLFLGRLSMLKGWYDLLRSPFEKSKPEFVSMDAQYDRKQEPRAYEMLSTEANHGVTPAEAVVLPSDHKGGRRTPDYFGETARYHAPQRSFSRPAPPPPRQMGWDPHSTYATPVEHRNPLGMNNV